MNPQGRKLVEEYLESLRQSLSAWPARERDDSVAEVRSHIEEALTRAGREDPATVVEVLGRMGDPQQFALVHVFINTITY